MKLNPTLSLSAFGLLFALIVPVFAGCGGGSGSEGGSAGSAGGGAGGGTTGGTGGSTGGTGGTGGASTCADVCPAVLAAACSAGPPDEASCEAGCASVMQACGAEFGALLACGGDNPTFVCDADGNPYPQGCDAENTALVQCMSGVPAVCVSICPSVTAAACMAGPPNEAACESGCAQGKTKCPTEFAALEACVPASPTAACDAASGSPYVEGCQSETLALLACLSM
ncbi:MAG: hypothetical protein U0441_34495 [Polyangiaceae bacterium]